MANELNRKEKSLIIILFPIFFLFISCGRNVCTAGTKGYNYLEPETRIDSTENN